MVKKEKEQDNSGNGQLPVCSLQPFGFAIHKRMKLLTFVFSFDYNNETIRSSGVTWVQCFHRWDQIKFLAKLKFR